MHRVVGELVAIMPRAGEAWPRRARERWLAALSAVLDVLYDEEQGSSPPRARIGRQHRPETEPSRSPFVDGPRPGEPPTDVPPSGVEPARSGGEPTQSGGRARTLDLRPAPIPSASRGRHARPLE